MSSSPASIDDVAIRVSHLGKCHQMYDKPQHRLWQSFWRGRKRLYREFWALRDITLEIRRGETVGIIGPNGSGKSTLLQMIAGTLTPSTGTVEVKGRVAALLELGSGFNHEFTGRENVFLNGAVLGLAHEEIERRFGEIAAFANIGPFMDQPTKTYSSGMVVRLAFAVSVCVEPDVLIVDEALAVGDPSFQFKCLERLQALTKRGTTLLFCSQDMGMVKTFCHRALYLDKGRERARGEPYEMAQLYFLDVRNEDRHVEAAHPGQGAKRFLGEGAGMAFGSDEGAILSACFTDTGTMHSSYVHGDEIEVRAEVRFRDTVRSPHVSLVIQDFRLMALGGQCFALHGEPAEEGWLTASVTASFRVAFARGCYHVTVRLQDGESETTFRLVDKQVGLLRFDVMEWETRFLGTIDLGLRQVAARRLPTPALVDSHAA